MPINTLRITSFSLRVTISVSGPQARAISPRPLLTKIRMAAETLSAAMLSRTKYGTKLATTLSRSAAISAFDLNIGKSNGAIRSLYFQGRPSSYSYLNFPELGNKKTASSDTAINIRIR